VALQAGSSTRGSPVGYCTAINMSGPADVHLYPRETVTPHHIRVFEESQHIMVTKDVNEGVRLVLRLQDELAGREGKRTIDVNEMAMRNAEIASRNDV
jgi:hypothetical protein